MKFFKLLGSILTAIMIVIGIGFVGFDLIVDYLEHNNIAKLEVQKEEPIVDYIHPQKEEQVEEPKNEEKIEQPDKKEIEKSQPCAYCEKLYLPSEMNDSLFSPGHLICEECYGIEEIEYDEYLYQLETGAETTAPMCSNCGERPAVYVESELCEECAQSTDYQYGE